jgi:hypothetical protein
MQATVKGWEPTEGGSAYLSDGSIVALPPECLQGGPFRFLRLGQRIQLTLQDGVVVGIDLPGPP